MSFIRNLFARSQEEWRVKPFYPVGLILAIDIFLTLLLQPEIYWYSYLESDEVNPIGKILLNLHPLAFLFSGLFYILLAYLLIIGLSKKEHVIYVFLGIILFHTWPATNWVYDGARMAMQNIPEKKMQHALAFGFQMFLILCWIYWSQNTLKNYWNHKESES